MEVAMKRLLIILVAVLAGLVLFFLQIKHEPGR